MKETQIAKERNFLKSLRKSALTKLVTIGLISALTSCASISSIYAPMYIPHEKELRRIEDLLYIEGKFNCVDKAVIYADYVNENGGNAKVVSGHDPKGKKGLNHAWVEVQNPEDGKWYIIDPTNKSWKKDREEGFDTSHYFYKEPLYIYEKGVTPEEIRRHRNRRFYNEEVMEKVYLFLKNRI
jgi:hypothetical protein